MIKAVIFDAGGVLVDNPWPGMMAHYSKHLQVSEENFEKAIAGVIPDWHTGKIPETKFWERMAEVLQVDLPESESIWITGLKSTYREKEEVYELIKKLRSKGYKTAVLSNTEFPVAELLSARNGSYFDEFVYSCEFGIAKPEPEIYFHTLEKLGIKSEEAVFIDDKLENIEAAEKLGIYGVLFESPEQVKNSLETLLKLN